MQALQQSSVWIRSYNGLLALVCTMFLLSGCTVSTRFTSARVSQVPTREVADNTVPPRVENTSKPVSQATSQASSQSSTPASSTQTSSATIRKGVASYYADMFDGRLTANGEVFDQRLFTAAHKTLPFGTLVRVTNLKNNKSVVVRINDRGPFVEGRSIDLSRAAAEHLDMIQDGIATIEYSVSDSYQ